MKKVFSVPKHITYNAFSAFKKLSFKKKILTVILVVIGFIVVSQVIASATKKPPYTTDRVTRSTITEVVSETGSITTSGRTDVFSPTNGIVQEVYVANGDVVEEGQELFIVESSATIQEQQAAYANYLTASSTLNAAKSNLNTLRATMYSEWDTFRGLATNSTYETGDDKPNTQNREAAEFQIAQDEWLAAEAKYKDQQTVVAQAQSQVSSTWLLYQATQNASVTSPMAGTISNLSVTNGTSVAVKSPTLPTTPAVTIATLTTTEVAVALSESDITKVRPGQRATIDVSAVSDKTYRGVVRRVDDIGTDIQGVIRYNAYIEVLNADNNLRPGMTVDVEIVTEELKDTLSVPNAAVKPYQGGRAVRIPENGEPKYVPVQIGVRGEDRTQILKGLEEGQEIITTLSNEQIQRPGLFGN